jgi:hypothetical protein
VTRYVQRVTSFTCDACRRSDRVNGDDPPAGWTSVPDRENKVLDLCEACMREIVKADFGAFLAKVLPDSDFRTSLAAAVTADRLRREAKKMGAAIP